MFDITIILYIFILLHKNHEKRDKAFLNDAPFAFTANKDLQSKRGVYDKVEK